MLPDFNNERNFNQDFKDRFSSLQNLVLIKNKDDITIVPNDSEWFGYFADDGTTIVNY